MGDGRENPSFDAEETSVTGTESPAGEEIVRSEQEGPRPSRWWVAWATWAIIIGGSVLATALLMSDSLKAGWWITDDYQPMSWLDPDGKLTFSKAYDIIWTTEVGHTGKSLRCRPSYYAARLTEAVLWGNSPKLWYLSRLVMFAVSVALFWKAFSRWISLPGGAVAVAYCLTLPLWGDIWCRLGPAETYAVFGTALFVFGMGEVVRDALSPKCGITLVYWILLTFGALLAMGAKENFLLMLFPMWGLMAYVALKKRVTLTAVVCSHLMTVYGVIIGNSIRIATRISGRDVYGRKIDWNARLSLGTRSLDRLFEGRIWMLIAAGAVLVVALLLWWRHIPKFIRPLIRTALIIGCLVLLWVTQFIFYYSGSSGWPRGMRYDFPGVLAWPMLWVALAALGLEMIRIGNLNRKVRAVLYVAALVGMTILIGVRGFPLVAKCDYNVRRTRLFTDNLNAAMARIRKEPDRPVIMVSDHLLDVEWCSSFRAFVRANGITNPLYVDFIWKPTKTKKKLRPVLVMCRDRMMKYAKVGGPGFLPMSKLPAGKRPFAVGLSCKPPEGPYEILGQLVDRNW